MLDIRNDWIIRQFRLIYMCATQVMTSCVDELLTAANSAENMKNKFQTE
jgi:hypothetical protein